MSRHLEVLVEEPSMEAALEELIPKISPDTTFSIYNYHCKEELLRRLPDRLRGYSAWLPESTQVLVLIDRDDDSCVELKAELEGMAADAGLRTPSRQPDRRPQVVNRLAIEELEAWFFGDWSAVISAYPRVSPTIPQKEPFRDPDSITGGTWEALERVLQRAGYFKTGLRKIEVARAVSQLMRPEVNRSRSFQTFRQTILQLAE